VNGTLHHKGDLIELSASSPYGACVLLVGEYRRDTKAGVVRAYELFVGPYKMRGRAFEALESEVQRHFSRNITPSPVEQVSLNDAVHRPAEAGKEVRND